MRSTNLNVILLPIDIAPFDIDRNIEIVRQRLADLPQQSDLVVLPEMFCTGFTTDSRILTQVAQGPGSPVIAELESLSKLYKVAIWGTMIARSDDNRFVNRGFMISPDSPTEFYDKRHTFSLGGESLMFSRGRRPSPIIEFRGWRLKMAICYDIRFPIWNRSRANEYDALIVPANWVHSRYYPWRQMLIARAIENQAYVVGCNREGSDAYGKYERGDSLAFDFYGKEIGTSFADGTVAVSFDSHALESARKHFAPWRDADDFSIDLEP